MMITVIIVTTASMNGSIAMTKAEPRSNFMAGVVLFDAFCTCSDVDARAAGLAPGQEWISRASETHPLSNAPKPTGRENLNPDP